MNKGIPPRIVTIRGFRELYDKLGDKKAAFEDIVVSSPQNVYTVANGKNICRSRCRILTHHKENTP